MTEPDDGQAATRPISVAELLAKNGTIGSPPVGGGRRRKRRGNSDAVTVAELTGEIPIVRLDDNGVLLQHHDDGDIDAAGIDDEADGYADTHDDHHYVASRLEPSPDPMPHRGSGIGPELSHYPRPKAPVAVDPDGAGDEPVNPEAMTPDPTDDAPAVGAPAVDDELGIGAVDEPDAELFSGVALFGSEAHDLAEAPEDAERAVGGAIDDADTVEPIAGDLSDSLVGDVDEDLGDEYGSADQDEYEDYEAVYDYYDEPTRGQSILRGLGIALQSVLAVVLGAGLFLAFAQLWQWNSLIAMVLAILATLGLVAGVWVVRRTEDIASTLIAVGVGLLVTFGPLALMHATN